MPATISMTTAFNLRTSPKVFLFTDTTDWAGQGIALADVNGCIDSIIPPSGIPYYGNADFSNAGCDIRLAVALTNQLPISLPMAGGIITPGTYTIIYKVYNSDTDEYYTQEYSFVYSYVQPTLSISQLADCLSPLFTSTDNTVYAITGATLTLERTHTLNFPAGSAGAGTPVVNTSPTNPSITTSTLYNGTQTTTIASLMSYLFTDGLIIMDSLNGSREELVNCRDICSITCCITAFETRMNSVRERNYDLYLTDYKYQWLEMMGYVAMIKCLAIPCGVSNDSISYFMEKILTIGNCNNDCCTEADNFSQVVGLGVINVVVQSGGTPVIVTAVVASGTTTYTITLDPAFVAAVAAAYNTVVAAGDNITVTVVTAVDGTKTYTVNGKNTIVAAGTGITVTPSAEVDGVITYTVAIDAAAEPKAKYVKEFITDDIEQNLDVSYAERTGCNILRVPCLGTDTESNVFSDIEVQLWILVAGVWSQMVPSGVGGTVVGDYALTINNTTGLIRAVTGNNQGTYRMVIM